MPRKKKPRVKGQGVNYIIGELRKLMKDRTATVAQKIKVLDRLAWIDDIWKVKITDPEQDLKGGNPERDPIEQEVQDTLDRLRKRAKKAEESNASIPTGDETNGS